MTAEAKTGLTIWPSGALQQDVLFNALLYYLAALVGVLDKDLTAPPGSPADGATYIVGPSATGAWSGKDGQIAYYAVSAWVFLVPFEGIVVDVADEDIQYRYSGSAWTPTRHKPNVQSVISAATVTPTFADDLVKITAQAAALALANPTGTAIDGKRLLIRIKDDGTARAITCDTQYRALGVTLPTTTTISKTTCLEAVYNSDDAKWDVVLALTEA